MKLVLNVKLLSCCGLECENFVLILVIVRVMNCVFCVGDVFFGVRWVDCLVIVRFS